MKKILLSSFFIATLLTSLNGYELNGKLDVKWTGFKTEKKAPVSGTFKDISIDITKADNLTTFLKSAKVEIQTASFYSKNSFRDKNITSTLFALVSAEKIEGYISEVNEETKTLILQVSMNKVKKSVPMKYEITDNNITAKAMIDILDFDMDEPFAAFALKCAHYHENKSFSDVNIEFSIPYK